MQETSSLYTMFESRHCGWNAINMQECCLRTILCGYAFVGEECFPRFSGNHAESSGMGLFSSEKRDKATDEDLHGLSTTHDGEVEMPCVTQRYVAANTSPSPSICLPIDVGTNEVGHLSSGRLKDPSSNQHEKDGLSFAPCSPYRTSTTRQDL